MQLNKIFSLIQSVDVCEAARRLHPELWLGSAFVQVIFAPSDPGLTSENKSSLKTPLSLACVSLASVGHSITWTFLVCRNTLVKPLPFGNASTASYGGSHFSPVILFPEIPWRKFHQVEVPLVLMEQSKTPTFREEGGVICCNSEEDPSLAESIKKDLSCVLGP